jgi:chaperonin GroEL
MSKQIHLDDAARNGLKKGVEILTGAVASTLGPGGRNVVIGKKFGSPTITKDGVSVAKEIELEDPLQNMGAQILKEVASKTATDAGDGTTTATVLAHEIIQKGFLHLAEGVNPVEMKKGIDIAVAEVVDYLRKNSVHIGSDYDQIKQVATVSANGDSSIGELIAEAIKIVGKDGVVTVEEARSTETELKTVEGLQFDRGYLSPYFITNTEKMTCELEKPFIILYDKKISTVAEILNIMEQVIATSRPVLIIAEDVDQEALATLVVNRVRAGMKVCAVKAPGFGDKRKELLKDLAAVTGGTVITEDLGLKLDTATLADLGESVKVIIDKNSTIIVDGAGNKTDIVSRAESIRAQIESSTSDYEKEGLQDRLAKLTGGVAILRVGAMSEVEMKEKKDRVDDALHATRAAMEEGIVPGGGVALLQSKSNLMNVEESLSADISKGYQLIKQVLSKPLEQICENAGFNSEEILVIKETILANSSNNFGFDVRAEKYVDMIESGIIDPAKVTRVALQNAASVAAMIMTTSAAIVLMPEKEQTNSPEMGY